MKEGFVVGADDGRVKVESDGFVFGRRRVSIFLLFFSFYFFLKESLSGESVIMSG